MPLQRSLGAGCSAPQSITAARVPHRAAHEPQRPRGVSFEALDKFAEPFNFANYSKITQKKIKMKQEPLADCIELSLGIHILCLKHEKLVEK